jgi:hypothetical protein
MITKTEFIILLNRLINDEILPDGEFNKIIELLTMQKIVKEDYVKDDNLSQTKNLLMILCQNSIRFYETYLGQ